MGEQNNEQQSSPFILQKVATFSASFTDQAQRAFVFADEEAAQFNHNYIGTEHLLLGLLREEEGIAFRILKESGVELQRVRAAVAFIIGKATPQPPSTERGLTPRAQVVVTLAVSEGWRSSTDHSVGTEHVLLGLIREGEGIAAKVIERLGVSLEQVRSKVLQAILERVSTTEPPRDTVKNKSNVVTCRIDDSDMSAIDALVEVGIRTTRSDAASWLIHAGVEANASILEGVYETVTEIRQLRAKAQTIAQQVGKKDSLEKPEEKA
ncbi:MAG: hypothetical protein NVSMB49_06710 [Ktedonobacteraceae bacterium]